MRERYSFELPKMVPVSKESPSKRREVASSVFHEEQLMNSPLESIVSVMKDAGVGDEECARYRAMVVEFWKRPSVVTRAARENVFRPDWEYFRANMEIVQPTRLMRDLGLKPRLTRTKPEHLEIATVDPRKAWPTFVKRIPLTSKDVEELQPEDNYLVQLNRITYALHEALHIGQQLSAGDSMNALKTQLHAEDLFDPAIEAEIVATQRNRRGVASALSNLDARKARIAEYETSVLNPFEEVLSEDDLTSKERSKKAREVYGVFLGVNEITMDMLADRAIGDEIREHPLFVRALHNELMALIAAYQLAPSGDLDPDHLSNDERETLRFSLGIFGRLYFAAFTSTDEGFNFCRTHDRDPQTNCYISGPLVHGPRSLDYDGCMAMMYGDAGLHTDDAPAVAKFIEALQDAGYRAPEFRAILNQLRNNDIDRQTVWTSIPMPGEVPSVEYFERLAGPSFNIFAVQAEDYAKYYPFRKALLNQFIDDRRFDIVGPFIRGPLFRADYEYEGDETIPERVTGLSTKRDTRNVLSDTEFSIVKLDVPRLRVPQQQRLLVAAERYIAEYPQNPQALVTFMSTVVNLKRRQDAERDVSKIAEELE